MIQQKIVFYLLSIGAVIATFLFNSELLDPILSIRYLWCSTLFFFFFLFVNQKNYMISFYTNLESIKKLSLFYLPYLLFILTSSIWAFNSSLAIESFIFHSFFFVTCLIWIYFFSKFNDEYLLFRAISITSLVHAIIGYCQKFDFAFLEIPGSPNQPIGLMGNNNLFGSAQTLSLVFTLMLIYLTHSKWKNLYRIIFIIVLGSIVVSNCKSAYIGTIALIFFFETYVLFYLKGYRRNLHLKIISLVCICLVIVGVGFLVKIKGNALYNQANFKKEVPKSFEIMKLPTVKDRIQIWNQTLKLFYEKPIIGVGAANWKVSIRKYTAFVDSWKNGKYSSDRVHNIWLQNLSEIGLVGLLLFCLLFGYILFFGCKKLFQENKEDQKIIKLASLLGIIIFLLDGTFSFPDERIEHMLFVSIFIGMIFSQPSSQTTNLVINKRLTILKYSFFFFLAINLYYAFEKYRFEKQIAASVKLISEGNAVESNNILDSNYEILVKFGAENLYTKCFLKSNNFFVMKDYDNALIQIDKALKLNPYSADLITQKAAILMNLQKFSEAISQLNFALNLMPEKPEIYKNLANSYYLNNQLDSCKIIIKKFGLENDSYFQEIIKKIN